MASYKPDLIRDAGAVMDKDCIKVLRSIWVKGLSGTNVPYEALTSCGVSLGDYLPGSNLYCNSIEMRPVQSVSQAAIVATYLRMWINGGRSGFLVEYDGGVSVDATNVDIDNNPLRVDFYSSGVVVGGPDTVNGVPNCLGLGHLEVPKLATVQVPRPVGQLKVMQYIDVTDDNEDALDDLVKKYQGFTNSTSWRGRPKWSWLCSNVSVVQATIRQFCVTMQFDWKPLIDHGTVSTRRGNWVANCGYIMPEGAGQPPLFFMKADVDGFPGKAANGYLMGKVLGSVDFNALGF